MRQTQGRMTVSIDGYTRFCLTAIAVLLTILVIGLWANPGESGMSPVVGRSGAAPPLTKDPARTSLLLPGAAGQRQAMLDTIKVTNKKLDKIATLLKSGEVRVVMVNEGADKAAGNVKKPSGK